MKEHNSYCYFCIHSEHSTYSNNYIGCKKNHKHYIYAIRRCPFREIDIIKVRKFKIQKIKNETGLAM